MVKLAVQQEGVAGSRMMGGGFGGCTVNLVNADAVKKFKEKISSSYFSATGLMTDIYVCLPSGGAGLAKIESGSSPVGAA
jgi:galactokinase